MVEKIISLNVNILNLKLLSRIFLKLVAGDKVNPELVTGKFYYVRILFIYFPIYVHLNVVPNYKLFRISEKKNTSS